MQKKRCEINWSTGTTGSRKKNPKRDVLASAATRELNEDVQAENQWNTC